MIKARVNAIHTMGSLKETKSIDGPISFPPVNPNRVIVPHYDALMLTLCISSFDVHRVLVDRCGRLVAGTFLQPDEAFLINVKLSRANPLWFQ